MSALLLAGGSAAAFAESFRSVDATNPTAGGDPLFEHIQNELARMLRGATATGGVLTIENAAAGAACVRIGAAHARGLNLDQVARDALARASHPGGRELLLVTRGVISPARERLRSKGVPVSDRIGGALAIAGRATRAAALDAIENGRSTTICDRLGEALEAAAARLAYRKGPVMRIAATDEWLCSVYLGQWSIDLVTAWYLASFEDPALQDFVDSALAGFAFHDHLYTTRCPIRLERPVVISRS